MAGLQEPPEMNHCTLYIVCYLWCDICLFLSYVCWNLNRWVDYESLDLFRLIQPSSKLINPSSVLSLLNSMCSSLQAVLCGGTVPPPVLSYDSMMVLHFTSDSSVTARGFHATPTFIKRSGLNMRPESKACRNKQTRYIIRHRITHVVYVVPAHLFQSTHCTICTAGQ